MLARSPLRKRRLGPPCGCLNIGQCVHIDHDAPRLREPDELGPRCSGRDRLCLALGVPEREALGRQGLCCADLLTGVAS